MSSDIASDCRSSLDFAPFNGVPRKFPKPVARTQRCRCGRELNSGCAQEENPMSLFNLRIRGRLYGGFGALVLFGVLLAGFAVWQLWAIRDRVESMTIQSANSIRAGGIATELHAIRRGILRYTFDQDAELLADADKRLANIGTLLDAAIKTVRAEERRAAYKDIEKDIGELKSKRDRSRGYDQANGCGSHGAVRRGRQARGEHEKNDRCNAANAGGGSCRRSRCGNPSCPDVELAIYRVAQSAGHHDIQEQHQAGVRTDREFGKT